MFLVEITDPDIESALEKEIEEAVKDVAEFVANDAPDEMRLLMPEGGVSAPGEPPRRRTGNLAESLEATAEGSIVTVQMLDYGGYLDPEFKDQGFKGAGWANRPFIESGINKALEKL